MIPNNLILNVLAPISFINFVTEFCTRETCVSILYIMGFMIDLIHANNMKSESIDFDAFIILILMIKSLVVSGFGSGYFSGSIDICALYWIWIDKKQKYMWLLTRKKLKK